MGVRIPHSQRRQLVKKVRHSKEMKSSIDSCVDVQESLASHYTGLKTHFGQMEVELEIASTLLCCVTARIADRINLINFMKNKVINQ